MKEYTKYDVDVEQFWKDDQLAHEENCFSKKAPQAALGIRMSDECVFAELNEEGDPWGKTDPARQSELNKRYNDLAEQIVGKRLLNEKFPAPDEAFPVYKEPGEVLGGVSTFEGGTFWLHSDIHTPLALEAQLDKIDRMNIRDFILPDNWESEKKRIFEKYGKKPGFFIDVRGPVTLATTIYGIEETVMLYYDAHELFLRFSETIKHVILEYIRIFAAENNVDVSAAPHYFCFRDDDCAMFTPDMYEEFGYPILKEVFETVCPLENHMRYQHSDSAMGHLLPILARLNLGGCQFGPNITVREIRKHMPKTRIDGQLAPFTFMGNDEEAIIAEVRRDCEMARENDARGLRVMTAGSINNGSLLTSMRAAMYAVQKYGRY